MLVCAAVDKVPASVVADKLPLTVVLSSIASVPVDENGQIIFVEDVQHNLAVIELDNGDVVVGGRGAFLDGGYGGSASIMRLSFSN